MSVLGTFEVIVNLETFRNINCHYQGIYSVRLTCATKTCNLKPLSLDSRSAGFSLPHSIIPGSIAPGENSVTSRSFYLRYADEIIPVNECIVFRGEFPYVPGKIDEEFKVKAELLFTDMEGTINAEEVGKITSSSTELELRAVSVEEYRISNVQLGANQYIPISFTETYASVFHATFHCMLIGCRFAVKDFFSGYSSPLKSQVIDKVYHSYAMLMALTYNKMRKLVKRVLKKANCKDAAAPEKIKLPVSVNILTKMHHSVGSKLLKSPLTTCVGARDIKTVSKVIAHEITLLVDKLLFVRSSMLSVFLQFPAAVVQVLETDYNDSLKLRLDERFSEMKRDKQFFVVENLDVQDAKVLPDNIPSVVEESSTDLNLQWSPHWFSSRLLPRKKKNVHLFVLVHGLYGSAMDLKLFQDAIYLHLPQSIVICSKANQKRTCESIDELGKRLADEFVSIMDEHSEHCEKISFIGHSLGGLIIRAALPRLSTYRHRMHIFMSLNTPHLGCSGNSLIMDTGVWLMAKFKRIISLKQMALTDSGNFMLGLSKEKGLEWFKYCLFIGSSHDQYVAANSAAVSPMNSVQKDMATSLLQDLKHVIRLYVDFPEAKWGRKSHIHMLDSRSFHTMLIYRYAGIFI